MIVFRQYGDYRFLNLEESVEAGRRDDKIITAKLTALFPETGGPSSFQGEPY